MIVRRAVAGLAALALVGGGVAASQSAQAHHCRQMIMFSSHAAVGAGLNPGVGGCLLVNYEDENVNNNYFLPGADRLSVGLSADLAAWDDANENGIRDETVADGTVTVTYADPVTGDETTVVQPTTWTWSGTRWQTPNYAFPGVLVEATGSVLSQPNVVVSVTYRAVTEA